MAYIWPNALTDTSTTLPGGLQLGVERYDFTNQKWYKLLLANSGLTQAATTGKLMCGLSVANPFTVEISGASGSSIGSVNLPMCVLDGTIVSGSYFWGLIEGKHTALFKDSGAAFTAGMILNGASAASGAFSGVASGTASTNTKCATCSVAAASGTIAVSGYVTLRAAA